MINQDEAYNIARKKYNFPKLLSCLEFDSFYLFSFAPLLTDVSDGYFTGTIFDAVDKKDGRLYLYDITSDLDAFEKAKSIKIETILDKKVVI